MTTSGTLRAGGWLVVLAALSCGGGNSQGDASAVDGSSLAAMPDGGVLTLDAGDGSAATDGLARDTASHPDSAAGVDDAAGLIPGELLYLPFDEGSGNSVRDSSPLGTPVTVAGQPPLKWTLGRVRGALTFDGTYSLEVRPLGLSSIGQSWTAAAWARIDKAGSAQEPCGCQTILSSGGLLRNGHLWFGAFQQTPAGGRGGMRAGVSGGQLPLGEWHHVAATYRTGRLEIFRDGASVRVVTPADLPGLDQRAPPSDGLRVGVGEGGAGPWSGALDEVRLYGRVLTNEEIRALATP